MRLLKSKYTTSEDSNQPWDEGGESCVGLLYCLNALRHNLDCHTVTLLSQHHHATQLHQLIFVTTTKLENDSFGTFFRTILSVASSVRPGPCTWADGLPCWARAQYIVGL
jgi:hypothetical protein